MLKHTIKLNGKSTSVRMQQPQFDALKAIARGHGLPVASIVEQIKLKMRTKKYPHRKLSVALRAMVDEETQPEPAE